MALAGRQTVLTWNDQAGLQYSGVGRHSTTSVRSGLTGWRRRWRVRGKKMAARPTEQVATLQRQLDEATRRAESLRRVIETISGELALAPLLTRIIQSAVELIGADD